MFKPPQVTTDVKVNELMRAPSEAIICWPDSNHNRLRSTDSSSVQAWGYGLPGTATLKGAPNSAYQTRPRDWAIAVFLAVIIVAVTALSGMGAASLFNDGIQVSSGESDAADPSSDVHARELIQVHRDAVLRR